VDFCVLPHLNNPYFENLRKNNDRIQQSLENTSQKVYILDDNSAVKVVDGKAEIITEGEHLVFNDK